MVESVLQYSQGARETNATAWSKCGIDDSTLDLYARKRFYCAFMRGAGFWDWMELTPSRSSNGTLSRGADNDLARLTAPVSPSEPLITRRLPIVNFIRVGNTTYIDVIVEEALSVDRERFRLYLSHRPLGLGMITAGPRPGKNTA
ncbi:hypothetical protein LX36DRAFT_108763 [Colletotrichum falcatum]|nr:hypothetical protein LX36DRAFT_108763 [Colletotrichum falcatum]